MKAESGENVLRIYQMPEGGRFSAFAAYMYRTCGEYVNGVRATCIVQTQYVLKSGQLLTQVSDSSLKC